MKKVRFSLFIMIAIVIVAMIALTISTACKKDTAADVTTTVATTTTLCVGCTTTTTTTTIVTTTLGTTTTVNCAAITAALAYPSSDMETDMHNTTYTFNPTGSGYSTTDKHCGSRSVGVTGTTTANAYLYTSAANMNAKGANTKLSFYVRGTCPEKSLVIQIGASADQQYFNCGVIAGDVASVSKNTQADYTGSVNCPQWAKVTCDISSVTETGKTLSVKVGKTGNYSLYVDDFFYEP